MALFILLGAGIDGSFRKSRAGGMVPAIAILSLFCFRLYTTERTFRTDFRQIGATLTQQLNPNEGIVMVPAWQDDVLRRYLRNTPARFHLAEDFNSVKIAACDATHATGHCCVVVVGGGPKRTERNLSFRLAAISELRYSVEIERVSAYYHAYVLSVTDESYLAITESASAPTPTFSTGP